MLGLSLHYFHGKFLLFCTLVLPVQPEHTKISRLKSTNIYTIQMAEIYTHAMI